MTAKRYVGPAWGEYYGVLGHDWLFVEVRDGQRRVVGEANYGATLVMWSEEPARAAAAGMVQIEYEFWEREGRARTWTWRQRRRQYAILSGQYFTPEEVAAYNAKRDAAKASLVSPGDVRRSL